MFSRRTRNNSSRFRRGDTVVVRSEDEILATLDSQGKLEGLPFMPEMRDFCGRKFRVFRRAEKVFLDYHCYVGRMKGTVLLEGARCDGASHSGCQMGCLTLWKEAWLKPAKSSAKTEPERVDERSSSPVELPITNNGRFCCQPTELIRATSYLPWWDPRQYLRDLVLGEVTFGQLARGLLLLTYNKLQRMRGRKAYGFVRGKAKNIAASSLDVRTGDTVEVRSITEIADTLDTNGKKRGLKFLPEMTQFCGGRYRVASRVDRAIVEWSGQLRQLTGTVALEGVTCQGFAARYCPRSCFHLWRDTWLKKVQ